MAAPQQTPTHQCLLAAIVLAALLSIPAAAQYSVDYGGGYLLGDCRQDPGWSSTTKGAAFRAGLRPLLAALPSAAAPTGFASLRSANGSSSGGAFVRGFCYGESRPSPHDCRRCLSTALAWTWICNGSGRAGFWSPGCFLAYGGGGGTDASSSGGSEDDDEKALWRFDYAGDVVANYYPEFYDVQELVDLAHSLAPRAANSSGRRMVATANVTAQASSAVRVVAQCTENVTAADCARCLEGSAQELSERLRAQERESDGEQSAGVANVFRYDCYLRLEISAPTMSTGARIRRKMKDHPAVVAVLVVAIVVVIAGASVLVLKRTRTSKSKAQAPS